MNFACCYGTSKIYNFLLPEAINIMLPGHKDRDTCMHWDLIPLCEYHAQALLHVYRYFALDDVICSIVYEPQTCF
jgi:hypothetical protein